MSKVTVVGAGNVGATCANVLVTNQMADDHRIYGVVQILQKHGYEDGNSKNDQRFKNRPMQHIWIGKCLESFSELPCFVCGCVIHFGCVLPGVSVEIT